MRHSKFLAAIIASVLVFPALVPASAIYYAKENRVCGVDGKNYPSQYLAESRGVDVSYDFPCEFPKTENGLYERSETIETASMLLDFYDGQNKDLMIVRNNSDQRDYFVEQESSSLEDLKDFLPGDQLQINGVINKNTGLISAGIIKNLSLESVDGDAFICKLESLDSTSINCSESGSEGNFNILATTRIIAGLKNPGTLNDLRVGDILNIRRDKEGNVKTLLLRESGKTLFVRSHVFRVQAWVSARGETDDSLLLKAKNIPESIQAFGLNPNNDLTLYLKPDTKLVKKYFGRIKTIDIQPGHELDVYGRISDDGQLYAMTIKDLSLWR
jgi:hypothetical protein